MKLSLDFMKGQDIMTVKTADFISTETGKIYYEVAGEGHPLVMCHAGFVDSGMWNAQWEVFKQHYRVIRYDMGGYGQSDALTAPVSRRHELATVLQHLGIERAHFLGCSMSGTTVIDFALENPDMVSALIVVSATPSGFEMQGAPPLHMMEMFGALQQGDFETASDLQIRIWIDGAERQPEQVDNTVREHAKAMNMICVRNNTFLIADMQPLNPLDPPAVTRLDMISAPTLILAGALDHPEILRAMNLMHEQIPHAQKQVIADSAHVPNMEQAQVFNQVVLDFLNT